MSNFDEQRLEALKALYASTAPNLPLDMIAEIERLQADLRALANLRAAAQAVLQQAERDLNIGLGLSHDRLNIYEVGLTGEQIAALRVALRQAQEGSLAEAGGGIDG